jgi:hypothetical protein
MSDAAASCICVCVVSSAGTYVDWLWFGSGPDDDMQCAIETCRSSESVLVCIILD